MNPLQHQAQTADTLRRWGQEHGKSHLTLMADALDRDLSRTLVSEYEGREQSVVTRPSEDETGAPTRAQLARQDELLCEYPNHAVFIDPLYAGDVSMEVWTLDGEGPLHVETVDPQGEPK